MAKKRQKKEQDRAAVNVRKVPAPPSARMRTPARLPATLAEAAIRDAFTACATIARTVADQKKCCGHCPETSREIATLIDAAAVAYDVPRSNTA